MPTGGRVDPGVVSVGDVRDSVTATGLLSALRRREVSPLELLEASVVRDDEAGLNAVVWRDLDRARAEAADVDGPPTSEQPLRGLPMTVKESFDIAHAPTC
jgi:amidase